LLETIEGLVKSADVIRAAGINKPWGLLTVDNFIKSTVEEGILDIKLANSPRAGDGILQNEPDGSLFDNWTESLIIVEARTLRVATNNPACFVAGKATVKLLSRDPLPRDNISMQRDHVLLSRRDWYTSVIAACQRGSCIACLYVVGTGAREESTAGRFICLTGRTWRPDRFIVVGASEGSEDGTKEAPWRAGRGSVAAEGPAATSGI
jgi:hypothetical protein